MGYTHYWTQRKNITALDWQEMQAAFVRILAKAKEEGLLICGPVGTGAPEFGSEHLAFNGDESEDCGYDYTWQGETKHYQQNGAHETFWIDRKLQRDEREHSTKKGQLIKWKFCKTDRKPYDVVVTAIGCYLETFWPQYFEFTSDGDVSEWQDGLRLACRALPEKGNQMQTPLWVQDGERWTDHGLTGKRYCLKKHVSHGWMIVDQSKPMLEPEFFIPEEAAIRAASSFENRCYGQIEYTRRANKLIAGLMRVYSPEALFIRNQTAESVMAGEVWQTFKKNRRSATGGSMNSARDIAIMKYESGDDYISAEESTMAKIEIKRFSNRVSVSIEPLATFYLCVDDAAKLGALLGDCSKDIMVHDSAHWSAFQPTSFDAVNPHLKIEL